MQTTKKCRLCGIGFIAKPKTKLTCSRECGKKYATLATGRKTYGNELPSATIGAISEIEVAMFLMRKEYSVFRALSQACFCDLIAVKGEIILKVEARTGYIGENGKVTYPKTQRGVIDCYGIYIPRSKQVMFFDLDHKEIIL